MSGDCCLGIVGMGGNGVGSVTPEQPQSGIEYRLVPSDVGKLVTMNNASPNTVVVTLNNTAAIPIGSELYVAQYGAGATTLVAGEGVVLRYGDSKGLQISEQWGSAMLRKRTLNEWVATGALSSAADPGLALLLASSAWVDADESTISTVDTAGAIDLRADPAYSALSISADVSGPEGELGLAISESNGTTGAHAYRLALPADVSFGYLDMRYRIRPTAEVRLDHTATPESNRWRGPFSVNHSTYPYIYAPADYDDDEEPTFYGAGGVDTPNHNNRATGYHVDFLPDDWLDVRLETQIFGFGSAMFGPEFRSQTITGNNSEVFRVASLEWRQQRVSDVSDVRDTTSRFSQSTNENRLCLAPDVWRGTSPAFVESWNNGVNGMTPLESAGDTPICTFAVMHIRNTLPPAASAVLMVGDVELQVGVDGKWHLVQGVVDTDLGVHVAAVPVCVGLQIDSGTAEVYIDGQSIGAAALSQGATGLTAMGSQAAASMHSLAHYATAQTAGDIAAISATLRQRAGLPEYWPLVIWAGQSNSTSSGSWKDELAGSGMRSVPGYACRYEEGVDVSASSRWITGPHLDQLLPDSGFNNQTGSAHGWLKKAVDNEELQTVICTGQGGRSVLSWLPANEQYLHVRGVVDDAIGDFGTHLVQVKTFVFIQGEADTTTADNANNYLSRLRSVRSWIRSTWGSDVNWVGLRLHGDYQPTAIYQDTIRAAQDTFASEDPRTAYVDPTLATELGGDLIHFAEPSDLRTVGELLFLASQTL